MNKYTIAAAVALIGAGGLAACSQPSQTASTETTTETTAPASEPAPPIANPTQAFLDKAAQTDVLEIETAKVAQKKSTNKDVKALAAMLIKDHTKTTQQLKDWSAANAGFTLPAAPDADFQMRIDNIKNADANGFDDKYLDTVIDAHEAGLAAFKDYADNGDNPSLKAWATKVMPTLQAHFDKAKALRDVINKKPA